MLCYEYCLAYKYVWVPYVCLVLPRLEGIESPRMTAGCELLNVLAIEFMYSRTASILKS